MELSILYFKGFLVKILKKGVFLPLKIVFILANSADEMLHCLPKYQFTGIQNEKCCQIK